MKLLKNVNKIKSTAEKLLQHCNIADNGFNFKIYSFYPPHWGLGSGTKIKLSIAKLITESINKPLSAIELSTLVGRGGTSGVGTF